MVYLTYNDYPGGVYQSQVIDTCRYLENIFEEEVLLIAFISARNFWTIRKKIKETSPHSFVLPMYPGITNWRKNLSLLKLAMLTRSQENVIARGVFATLLARESRKFLKVCFDARGAYMAEWAEYMKKESPGIEQEMRTLESAAVLNTDSRIAVSQKLVDYWKENFHYSFLNHVVIPCTLNSDIQIEYNAVKIKNARQALSIADNEVLLVYSGSSAKWQSFKVLNETVEKAFSQNPSIKLLMLCKAGEEKVLADKFPGRVIQKWVNENEVQQYLQAADYGLLVREDSVTNQVSSPVKFAEYLAAGLPVIISEKIGDFSAFVQDKNCGMLVNNINWATLNRPDEAVKKHCQTLAEQFFLKSNYESQYKKLF